MKVKLISFSFFLAALTFGLSFMKGAACLEGCSSSSHYHKRTSLAHQSENATKTLWLRGIEGTAMWCSRVEFIYGKMSKFLCVRVCVCWLNSVWVERVWMRSGVHDPDSDFPVVWTSEVLSYSEGLDFKHLLHPYTKRSPPTNVWQYKKMTHPQLTEGRPGHHGYESIAHLKSCDGCDCDVLWWERGSPL